MPSVRARLAEAAARLAGAGVPTPLVDAELLLAHATGRSRLMLRMGGWSPTAAELARFDELVGARAERVPLQHLTGVAHFRHLDLRIGPGAFVPRPETETLVDHVRAFLGGAGGTVVDLCTGSGAIALAIATEVPGCRVVGVELAAEAIAWAGINVEAHRAQLEGVGSTVDLLHADATTIVDGPLAGMRAAVDAVVSNPPYIPTDAVPRDPEVRDHDPELALYGGPDGLAVIRPLVAQAAALLRPGGLLLVEHADTQGEGAATRGVPGLLRADGADGGQWTDVADHLDLAGRPRVTSALRAGARARTESAPTPRMGP